MRMYWIRNLMTHNADGVPNKSPTTFLVTTSQYQKMTRHYPKLGRDTCFVTGIDKKRREIPLALIYNALGATKATSLPGFHPLSGETSLNDLPARENWLFGKCWKNLTQTMTKYRHFYSFIIWSSHCCH